MQPDRPAGVVSKPGEEGPLLPHHRRQPAPPGSGRFGDAAGMVTPVGMEIPVVPKLSAGGANKPADAEQMLAHTDPSGTQRFERYDPAAADAAARVAAAAKRDARRPEVTPASAQAPWLKEDSLMEEQARRNRSPQKAGPSLNAPGLPYDPIANQYMGSAGAQLAQQDAAAAAAAAQKAALVGQRDSHGREYNLVNNLPQQPFIPVPGATGLLDMLPAPTVDSLCLSLQTCPDAARQHPGAQTMVTSSRRALTTRRGAQETMRVLV
jgi:hypothetical protein